MAYDFSGYASQRRPDLLQMSRIIVDATPSVTTTEPPSRLGGSMVITTGERYLTRKLENRKDGVCLLPFQQDRRAETSRELVENGDGLAVDLCQPPVPLRDPA